MFGTTVKFTPLLGTLPSVTTTLPEDAPAGTVAVIDAALQLVIEEANVPSNATVLLFWVVPKFAPEIVTDDPTAPDVGVKLAMLGFGEIVKLMPLLLAPFCVIEANPPTVPAFTVATTCVSLQLTIEAAV